MKEHSCRLDDPKKFYQFRRKQSGDVVVVVGRPHGMKKTRAQSIRYPVDKWSEEVARESCLRHKGKFHPAVAGFEGLSCCFDKSTVLSVPTTSPLRAVVNSELSELVVGTDKKTVEATKRFGNPVSTKGLTKGALIIGGSLLLYFFLKRSGNAGPIYPGSKYYELIQEYAEPSIPKVMIMAIIEKESYGNAKQINTKPVVPRYGLMGIWYDAAYHIGYTGTPEGLLDPKTNIYYGSRFLEYLIFTATRKYSEASTYQPGVKMVLGTADLALAWYGNMNLVIDPQTNLPMTNGYVEDIDRLMRKYVEIYGYQ